MNKTLITKWYLKPDKIVPRITKDQDIKILLGWIVKGQGMSNPETSDAERSLSVKYKTLINTGKQLTPSANAG